MAADLRLHLCEPVHRRNRVHCVHQQSGQVWDGGSRGRGGRRPPAKLRRLPGPSFLHGARRSGLQYTRPTPGHVRRGPVRRLQLRSHAVAGSVRFAGRAAGPAAGGRAGQCRQGLRVSHASTVSCGLASARLNSRYLQFTPTLTLLCMGCFFHRNIRNKKVCRVKNFSGISFRSYYGAPGS